MIPRLSKIMLLFAIAFYFTLVVFNNVTDYESNRVFVAHTLSMDTTFPGNRGMWRAIRNPTVQTLFYLSIIAWEAITGILCWLGGARLLCALHAPAPAFNTAKTIGIAALTLGLLLWLVAFLSVGGEWFLMWQSHAWNGQDAAFRMFMVLGVVLLYLGAPEHEAAML